MGYWVVLVLALWAESASSGSIYALTGVGSIKCPLNSKLINVKEISSGGSYMNCSSVSSDAASDCYDTRTGTPKSLMAFCYEGEGRVERRRQTAYVDYFPGSFFAAPYGNTCLANEFMFSLISYPIGVVESVCTDKCVEPSILFIKGYNSPGTTTLSCPENHVIIGLDLFWVTENFDKNQCRFNNQKNPTSIICDKTCQTIGWFSTCEQLPQLSCAKIN